MSHPTLLWKAELGEADGSHKVKCVWAQCGKSFQTGEQLSNSMSALENQDHFTTGVIQREASMTIKRDLNSVGPLGTLPSLSIFIECPREQSQRDYSLIRERCLQVAKEKVC